MTKKPKFFGRPPVGGYGSDSERLTSSIRVSKSIYKWVMKVCGGNVAEFIRQLIIKEKERRDGV